MSSQDTIQDIQRLETSLYMASAYMSSNAVYEDVAIFLGTSKSGKSSLINYLIGNKLVGKKIFMFKPPVLQKADISDGPQIGIQSTSETLIPTRYNSQKISELVVWDTPGDIICDNISATLSLLNMVENILQDRMKDCFAGIAAVFTKVPNILHENSVDRSLIAHILNEQLLSSDSIKISQSAKDLITHLTTNIQNIGLFKQATEGIVTDDIENGILEAIQSVESISESILKQVSPGIAKDSELFLYKAREDLSSMNMFVNLQSLIQEILMEKLSEIQSKPFEKISQEDLSALSQNLTVNKDRMVRALEDNISFHSKIFTLRSIDEDISKFIDKHDLCRKAQLTEFVDKLLKMNESRNFNIHLQNILVAGRQKIDELLISVTLHLGQIQQKEADKKLASFKMMYEAEVGKLKWEMEKLKEENKNNRFDSRYITNPQDEGCLIL